MDVDNGMGQGRDRGQPGVGHHIPAAAAAGASAEERAAQSSAGDAQVGGVPPSAVSYYELRRPQEPAQQTLAEDSEPQRARQTSFLMRMGLGTSMILMGLSYGSSILAILVGLSMLGGFEMAAEGAWMLGLLDYSSRDAFDAGVIAGLIVMSVSTLVALVAYLVRREELPVARYVPPYLLTLLSAVYFVCGATVAYAAWYGDGFNAVGGSFFLTLSTLLPVFVLPAWLVRWSYMLIVALWRWGSAGPYRAGLLTALLLLPIWPAFHYASIVSGDAAETYRYRMSLDTERAPGAARPSTGVVTDAAYELAEFFVEQWP